LPTTYIANLPETIIPSDWRPLAFCDFNGDSYNDLLWRQQSTGVTALWYIGKDRFLSGATLQLSCRLPLASWWAVTTGFLRTPPLVNYSNTYLGLDMNT